LRPFVPLFRNPDLLTIAAHLWPRRLDHRRYPVHRRLYRTDPETRVLVEEQRPEGNARGDVILVHGLESSSRAGYLRSLAQALLDAGFSAHRLNLRSCGGTEALCRTAYHSGLTCDLGAVARILAAGGRPVFVVGFSLGGNVALKLAGELGEDACGLIAAVCAVSTPLDLAACVGQLERPRNRLYELRFLRALRRRMRIKHRQFPDAFPLDGLSSVRSVREFDDRFTAPGFGFRNAAEYYETQSAIHFLPSIRVPALLIHAADDPFIPPEVYRSVPPAIQVISADHGGHLGFLSRRRPRFWLDAVIVDWITARGHPRLESPGR
jgi:predicted alpha/beta-fold hydrolase